MKSLAIVGAGFCGTVAAIEFIRNCRAPAKVVLIDDRGSFGPGAAYGSHNKGHVLNVPAGNMSALHDDSNSFLEYCAARDLQVNSGSFVPRVVYGLYLTTLLEQAIEAAPDTVVVERVIGEVLNIQKCPDCVMMKLSDNREFRADHVLLTIGNSSPAKLWPFSILGPHSAYRDEPWGGSGSCMPPSTSSDSILLIGSGLTCLDILTRLAKQGHTGPITVLSRRGLKPHAHRGHTTYTLQHAQLTRDTLLTATPTALGYLKAVRDLLANASDTDWRDVIAALRACTPQLWARLSLDEKRRFLRHVRPYWDNHRHRAAPETIETFRAWKESGQVTLLKGRILSVCEADDKLECEIKRAQDQNIEHLRFDHIVNCTGPNTRINSNESPLIKQLLRDKLMMADTLGLGIALDHDFSVMTPQHNSLDWLSYVGPMLKTLFWEATAVPELRQHASCHGARLAARFTHAQEALN